MTREQKIEWLRNANADKLLKQYEISAREADDPIEYSKRLGITYEEINENYELARAEVIRRMK